MPKPSNNSDEPREVELGQTSHLRVTLLSIRWLSLFALLPLALLPLSARVEWYGFELFVSFFPQVLILLWTVLFGVLILAARVALSYGLPKSLQKIGALNLGLFATAIGMMIVVFSWSINISSPFRGLAESVDTQSENMRVGTFNMWYRNSGSDSDLVLLAEKNLDILAMQEVEKSDVKRMKELGNFGHSYITDCDCSANDSEIALLSKYPIRFAESLYEETDSVVLRAELEMGDDSPLTVYAVHMIVPYVESAYDSRGPTYDQLADSVVAEDAPTILLGDFNTTVFSPQLRDFTVAVSDDVRKVTTRAWPRCSWYGATGVGCLRIDHVFVPKDALIYALEIGEEEASDHRSVMVELSI